ncbi:MAG: MnhB domain-containing protein [Caldilineaceae bacterium]|nr:MnhB domain-containing protein [Caldilineaceae bacterium]
MTELYLRLLDRVLTPVLLVLAIYLMLRGHNQPGGGFIAALMAATAFQLQIMSRGSDVVRKAIGRYVQPGIGVGLLLAVGSACVGLLSNNFFRGMWGPSFYLGSLDVKISTPLFFDAGVFFTVLGFSVSYLLGLSEAAPEFFEEEPGPAPAPSQQDGGAA